MAGDTITGVVTEISNDRFNSVYVNGEKYSNQFKELPSDISVGDNVTIVTNKPGQTFWKTVTKGGMASAAVPATPARQFQPKSNKGIFPVPVDDGQRSIIRQNALTNARELVGMRMSELDRAELDEVTNDSIASEIIRVARKFESYTSGDIERLEAEDLLNKDV